MYGCVNYFSRIADQTQESSHPVRIWHPVRCFQPDIVIVTLLLYGLVRLQAVLLSVQDNTGERQMKLMEGDNLNSGW